MEITKEILFKLYVEENKTATEIAKIVDKSPSTISSKLRKFDIPIRQGAEANINNIKIREERIGMIRENRFGSLMEIVEYNKAEDIWVKFIETNEPHVHTGWNCFIRGRVKSLYDKHTCGVGFIGVGEYKVSINGKETPQYKYWRYMMTRCYNEKYQKKAHTYVECSVIETWYNFQNFAKWFDENYYEIDGEVVHLDKDILVKGNKVYSPETCVFVPKKINSLFVKSDAARGKLPVGVCCRKNNKTYMVKCSDNKGNKKYVGDYKTPQEAFLAYKVFKESVIKQVAEEYKSKIPPKLYNALLTYEVEITD